MNTNQDDQNNKPPWQKSLWVVGTAGQAGLYIALPVVLGLFLGYFIDQQLGTIFLFALLFTMLGFVGGVILVYRWVRGTVQTRLEQMNKDE